MKTYSLIFIACVLFTGCYQEPCTPEVITRIETKEVYIPTKPKRPVINCEFTGTGNEPITKLLDCVILQKKIIKELTVE